MERMFYFRRTICVLAACFFSVPFSHGLPSLDTGRQAALSQDSSPQVKDAPPTAAQTVLPNAEILGAIKEHYFDAGRLSNDQISHAIVTNTLPQLAQGIEIVSVPAVAEDSPPSLDTFSEIVDGSLFYLRILGMAKPEVLVGAAPQKEWERRIAAAKNKQDASASDAVSEPSEIKGVVLDLRGFADFSNYEHGQRVASWFLEKGEPLFALKNEGAEKWEGVACPDIPPLKVPVVVIVNAQTAGVGEMIAEVLRRKRRALVVGTPTAGKAVVFVEKKWDETHVLRIASRRVVLSDGTPLFPGCVVPDLPLKMSQEEEKKVMVQALDEGIKGLLKVDRGAGRQNEAALVRGENPDIDSIRERWNQKKSADEAKGFSGKSKEPAQVCDTVLLSAIDLLRAFNAVDLKEYPNAGAERVAAEKKVPSRK